LNRLFGIALLLALCSACGGGGSSGSIQTGGGGTPPSAAVVTITIAPTTATVPVGDTQQFTANLTNASNPAVTWQVDGTSGGDSNVGTISSTGLYTAPSAVPNTPNSSVTVTAVSQADTTKSASAAVTIKGAGQQSGLFYATPLTDMSPTSLYLGAFPGMLFDDPVTGAPSNAPPVSYATAGKAAAARVQPLDSDGNPSPSGKIVMISMGMSIARREFCSGTADNTGSTCVPESFMCQAQGAYAGTYTGCTGTGNPGVNHTTLVLVNCGQESEILKAWADPSSGTWTHCNDQLTFAGVTPKQVQVIFFKDVNSEPGGSTFFNPPICCDMQHLLDGGQSCDSRDTPGISIPYPPNPLFPPANMPDVCKIMMYMGIIGRLSKTYYPNVQQMFVEGRSYSGYSTWPVDPEPFAYEQSFAMKWVITAQLKQALGLYTSPSYNNMTLDIGYTGTSCSGGACAPWIGWGPYLWAPACAAGQRSDGLCWNQSDFTSADYIHTRSAGTGTPYVGIMKATSVTLPYMLSNPYSGPWFAAPPVP
jgi:hypothetical protein